AGQPQGEGPSDGDRDLRAAGRVAQHANEPAHAACELALGALCNGTAISGTAPTARGARPRQRTSGAATRRSAARAVAKLVAARPSAPSHGGAIVPSGAERPGG